MKKLSLSLVTTLMLIGCGHTVKTVYVDRNNTVYVDRNNTVYVDRNASSIPYIVKNFDENNTLTIGYTLNRDLVKVEFITNYESTNDDYILEWGHLEYKEWLPVSVTPLGDNLWKGDIEIYLSPTDVNNTYYFNLLLTEGLRSVGKFKIKQLGG